jgi:Uma2 family endonuclease
MILQQNDGIVTIPETITSLDCFRKWARSPDFPETGRYSFLQGKLWVDLEMERLFSHNQVKSEISRVLGTHVKTNKLGYVFFDGALVTNEIAGIGHEPDATFVSFESIESGTVALPDEIDADGLEIIGTPDMVLEVVSRSSIKKDTVVLRELYWQAGIPEYWLVDARSTTIQFDILKHGPKRYSKTRPATGGWLKSDAFGLSFRIKQETDRLGKPLFTLQARE